jgi:hypothetical protein
VLYRAGEKVFKRKENRRAALVFLILPLLLVLAAGWLNNARGPFWLGTNYDPDYVYLLNSVNTAELKKVGHYDHPGTTVQVIGALTIRTVYLFSGSGENLKSDVLKRPEAYLNAINGVFVVLNAMMLYILGLAAFLITREIMLCIWLQLTPFFSTIIMTEGLTRVAPEPLLFFTAMFFTLLLVKYHRYGAGDKKIVIYFGLAAGFGMATKITFLPLMLMPFILFPGIRKKIVYGISALLSMVFFTLPIVSVYGKFYQWVYSILTHEGIYGNGPKGVISLQKYIGNITKLLTDNPMFTILLISTAAAVATGLLVPKLRRKIKGNLTYKLLTTVLITEMAGLLMVGKHPGNRYLLPVLMLTGIAVYGLGHFLKDFILVGENDYAKQVTAIVIFMAIAGIVVNPVGRLMDTAKQKAWRKKQSLELNRRMQNNYEDSTKIYSYGSSSLLQALKFGNVYSLNNSAELLDRENKNVYFYSIFNRKYSRFSNYQKMSLGTIEAKHGRNVIFQGKNWIKISGAKMKPLVRSRAGEGIYKLDIVGDNEVERTVKRILKEIPKNTALVIPKDITAHVSKLKDTFKVLPVNYKRQNRARLIRYGELLNNPFYWVPEKRFYGRGALTPKEKQRLKSINALIQPVLDDTDEKQPIFTFGKLRQEAKTQTGLHRYKQVKVWFPGKKNPEHISPTLHRLGEQGKFEIRYQTEREWKIVTISNAEISKQGKTFYRMGYRANKKGLKIEIPRGKLVHLVVSAKVPQCLINKDNYLFVQDYDKKWDRRIRQFSGNGWLTYVVSKRISPKSTRLQFGFYFRPQKPGDSISIREVKIFVENELK